MITGRFRVWKHVHKFEEVTAGRTDVIDEIDFELHYGGIGRLFEGYVRARLQDVFAHRKKATIAEFSPTR
jgi:ligand-binding SRPBCC domain-containing protein